MFNYTSSQIKNLVIEKPGFGAYFVVDNFLDGDLFRELCLGYEKVKVDTAIFTSQEESVVWHHGEPKGLSMNIGGEGADKNQFDAVSDLSSHWATFINTIYSPETKEYLFEIFSDTPAFKKNVKPDDKENGVIGAKLSSQTNNYGDRIHQDTTTKVLSFLLYMEKTGWNEDSTGGTDFWEVGTEKLGLVNDESSLEYKLRIGRFCSKSHSLSSFEAERIKPFLSVEFVPNRLVGFIRTDASYHSIPPRQLPNGITRDCCQINIWNFNRSHSVSIGQKARNFLRLFK
jgi:hypothetical protein